MDSVHHIWCPLSSQEFQDLPDGAETTLTDKLLNVTLCYPDNHTRPFYDMLSGRLTRIVVRINLVPIGEELHGDYVNDKNFKRSFQRWLNGLWEEKDRQLTDIMRDKER